MRSVPVLPGPQVHPLAALPSVLAVRDLRRRLRRTIGAEPAGASALRELFELDPPVVLRALRAVAAPLYRSPTPPQTIPQLLAVLGPARARRCLDVPTIDVSGTAPIRRLWLHTIATAIAARGLATQTGLLDPEEAYLLGLVHDLPAWLRYLGRRQGSTPSNEWLEDCLRGLQLTPHVQAVIRSCAAPTAAGHSVAPSDPATLLRAAGLLAEMADFGHPEPAQNPLENWLAACDKADLIEAQHLRHAVTAHLRRFGIDASPEEPDPEFDRRESREDLALFPNQPPGDLSVAVRSLLACSKSTSYRGISTAVTAAALRYGGYDRACLVRWLRSQDRVVLRTKADLSARPMLDTAVGLLPTESAALWRAFAEERPLRLGRSTPEPNGLLAVLAADELVVVPMNRDFQVPAFLLLDRALTARPLQLLQDTDLASTLGLTGSLLNETLLLRRRRQRAAKFATTDPLTRLHNRRMGVTRLEYEVERSHRTGSPLTVLMCDLDNFKQLNDQHGHLQGDQALRATADVLRRTLRKTDTICRYGGEEFMVVLPDTAPSDAAVLATRLFVAVEARGTDLHLPVTVSIGLTTLRPDDTAETLLSRADQALYASKSTGRNRFSADVETD